MKNRADFGAEDAAGLAPCKDDKPKDADILPFQAGSYKCVMLNKKIRALTYNMRPGIVAVSKSEDVQDRLNALQSGADDFISEPVINEEFVMRIKAHLRREFESNLDMKKLLPNKNYSLRALKRIVKTKENWASMLVTIDNFENYKEAYTELASDKLIQTFCAIIQSALNENDYLGAISDNEFLIITDIYKADKIANY